MNLLQRIYTLYLSLQKYIVLICLLAAGSLAFFLFLNASERYGIGINSDSIAYIRSAENLVNGIGLGRVSGLGSFKPMTHWPPLYSVVLALIHSSGVDIYVGARWLGAGLVFGIVLLAGLVFFRITHSPVFTLAGTAIFIYAPPMWETTLRIMSEPLFLVLALAGVLSLDQFVRSRKVFWLVLAGIWMSLSFLTRYAALALVLAGAITLLFIPKNQLKAKIKSSFLFGLISCIPIGIWLVYNMITAGTGTNRSFQFTNIPPSDYQQLLSTVISWFQPVITILNIGSGKVLLSGLLIALSIGIFLVTRNKKELSIQPSHRFLGWLFLIFTPIYAVFVIFSRYYFDSMIHIYRERITFPFYLALFILIFWFLAETWRAVNRKSMVLGSALILVLVFGWLSFFQGYKTESETIFKQTRNSGIGFARLRYEPPNIVPAYKSLPEADVLLCNNIELFYMLTGADAITLSDEITKVDMDKVTNYIGDRSAYFIVLNSRKLEKGLLTLNPDLKLEYQSEEGSIFRYH